MEINSLIFWFIFSICFSIYSKLKSVLLLFTPSEYLSKYKNNIKTKPFFVHLNIIFCKFYIYVKGFRKAFFNFSSTSFKEGSIFIKKEFKLNHPNLFLTILLYSLNLLKVSIIFLLFLLSLSSISTKCQFQFDFFLQYHRIYP